MTIPAAKVQSDVFFATHPVFTAEEYDAFLTSRSGGGVTHPEARKTLLRYHLKHSKILRIRRGLYASVPLGQEPSTYPVDSYLVAAHSANDGVLAYHTALSLHGIAQSVREERITLSTQTVSRSFRFHGVLYRTLLPPPELPAEAALSLGVETLDRQGARVQVTSLERTLVDAFDRLSLCGGWEEVWRSLEGLEVFLDFPFITRYVSLLNNATTIAKVGFFLECARERLSVPLSVLSELKRGVPKQPHYVERSRRSGAHLAAPWNLLIPNGLATTLSVEDTDDTEDIPL